MQKLIRLSDEGKLQICIDMTVLASDETSLRVGWANQTQHFGELLLKDDTQVPAAASTSTRSTSTQASVTKLMQAELVKCIGFKWADSECFELVSCQLPVKLYAGDHMTSANTYRIWGDITADQLLGPSLKSRARFHVDVSCTDRGANCGKTNRICGHMNPSRLRLCDLGCALHNGHLACKACLRPLRKLWSGTLVFTLSKQQPVQRKHFAMPFGRPCGEERGYGWVYEFQNNQFLCFGCHVCS